MTVYATYTSGVSSKIYNDVGGLKKANGSDSCYDLYCTETVFISPGKTALVPLGVKFAMPDGVEARLYARSSFPLKYEGLFVANGVGVIDNGYTGEVKLVVGNYGNKTVPIHKGDKIAQIEFVSYDKQPVVVNGKKFSEVSSLSDRKDGGLGSSDSSDSGDLVITVKDIKDKISRMALLGQCNQDLASVIILALSTCSRDDCVVSEVGASKLLLEIQNLSDGSGW